MNNNIVTLSKVMNIPYKMNNDNKPNNYKRENNFKKSNIKFINVNKLNKLHRYKSKSSQNDTKIC